MEINRIDAELKLKQVFGHSHFKDQQWEVISQLFQGSKVLLIEKTGFGKSLCFQFPSLYFDGIVLVFSPLIALMRDQVQNLKSIGIRAECINSDNTSDENERIINQASNNQLDLLYLAPERQESQNWENLLEELNISMIVIDEAHCISVWGHDFRPSYKRLVKTISKIPDVPILGSTATATTITEEDIASQIGDNIEIVRGNLARKNLRLHCIKTNNLDDKLSLLVQILNQINGTSIVFAGTHAETELISKILNFCGIKSVYYHAAVSNRSKIEREVLQDKWKCIVATNSFGMGIDKKNFRAIIHTRFPSSPIHYYQEIGRAGRDDNLSQIFLLWEPSDVELQHYFIEQSKPSFEKYYSVLEFIKKNPNCSSYDISYNLDFNSAMVENILVDLEEQDLIVKNVEYSTKPPEYILYDKNSITQITDVLGEKLTAIHTSIDTKTVDKFLNHLANNSSSEYTLAREILGRRTQINRQLIMKMVNRILNFQESSGKIFLGTNKRFERSTTYSIADQYSSLNEKEILKVKNNKLSQLKEMQKYLKYDHCRMKFLANYLGDDNQSTCGNCDYCILGPNIRSGSNENRWSELLDLCVYNRNSMFVTTTCGKCDPCLNIEEFYSHKYPHISLVYPSEEDKPMKERRLKLMDAKAIAYDFSKTGQRILLEGNSKHDYSEKTLDQLFNLYQMHYSELDIDTIMSYPSPENLIQLRKLTEAFGYKLKIPVTHNLVSTREIKDEASITTWRRKVENVKDAFEFIDTTKIAGKSILLICDIFHSKAMIREVGKYLSKVGVQMIQPIFLVKLFE